MDKPLTDEIYLAGVGNKMEQGKQNTFLFTALLIVLCVGAGCGILYYRGWQPEMVKLSCFLLLGFVFAAANQKSAASTGTDNPFPLSLLTAATIAILVLVFAYFTRRFQLFSNLSYAACFLLPVVLVEVWKEFVSLPYAMPRVWYYSADLPAEPPFVYFEKRTLRIKIILPDAMPFYISSATAGQLKLGMAFYFIGNEQNKDEETVPFLNENGRPYGWIFYAPRLGFQKKFLDPEETLYENHIPPNATIVAERLQ